MSEERPPYPVAACIALGALVLYVATLAPTTQFWDASEYITAAHALGIPHPPGNPLFVIIAHAWGLLPLGADYARRINLFAAATGAVAAGLWFLIGERWLRPIVPSDGPRRLAAAAGAIVGATAFTVWNQAVANEKVYTVSVLSIALTSTNHLMGVLVAPAVLAYVLWTDPRALLSPRFLVAASLVAAVGTSVYLFMPIRAHFDPYLNQGEPTTWQALRALLAREQFGKPSVFDNPMYLPGPDNPGHTLVLYGQQLLNYLQYFTWQFGRDWPAAVMEGIQESLAGRVSVPARRRALSAPVLLLALVPLAGNRLTASRAAETMARDYARDVLQSVDPYALVVTAGDNDTFPLWYAQEVEGVRRDVSVLVLSLANLDWYLRQLQRRPPPRFDPAAAPALYRGRSCNWRRYQS